MIGGGKVIEYIEIDIDYCSLEYGVPPCMAELGVTGDHKCFNTLSTCQDRLNFTNVPVTLRFGIPASYLPADIECLPMLRSVSVSPIIVSLGENMGQRATVNASFSDRPHSDTGPGFDKYWTERGYDPFKQGTFWGKFRARQQFLRGRPFRYIRGLVGQTLEEMETRHFVIESFTGPSANGVYSIIGKDVLKLADGDRAKAPYLSQGFLVSDITAVATTATLSPAGVGDFEYPTTGYLAIGGEEIVQLTNRVGDVLTIVRGQLGTTAVAHENEDRVQVVLRYVGIDPALIIQDLMVSYAGVSTEYIPIADWLVETGSFLQRVYTATIGEPTSVRELLNELIEQACLAIWWDEIARKIRLQVLRSISTASAVVYSEDNFIEGSLVITEQPNLRISQVWTYYGMRNPLEGVENPDNYRSVVLSVDAETEVDYGAPAIKTIFSRWIPAFGRTIAERINGILLARFSVPPRKFSLETSRDHDDDPEIGRGYLVDSFELQDAFGVRSPAPVQWTRIVPGAATFSVEGEEITFAVIDPVDLANRVLTIDTNDFNLNIREIHDSIYPVITDVTGITLTVNVAAGVLIGSGSITLPALTMGDWSGMTGGTLPIFLNVRGRTQGKGGNGGRGREGDIDDGPPPTSGQDGGVAIELTYPVTIDTEDGEVWGGGGGGGGSGALFSPGGGGGGAGQLPGTGGVTNVATSTYGDNGTTEAGGAKGSFQAGDGGGPGLVGEDGAGLAVGGAAGASFDGISFATVVGTGDIRGPQIG